MKRIRLAIDAGSASPVPGQVLVEPSGPAIVDPAEYVGMPSLLVDVVQLGGLALGSASSLPMWQPAA